MTEQHQPNKFFDDMSKVAGNAFGAMMGMKQEMENFVHQQVESWLKKMDVVSREEFEVVKAMAAKAREEQETLEKRLAELEKEFKN